ncbi:Nramp family divalent metal transporter [Flagellimonas sp.]|uniref:Nramp family divalent metal transporter n=1 Tax=Flagellimonas sp. TaxID=2058762 RepID=UPI003BB093B7
MIEKVKVALRSVGPGFIMAAVVLGPGSITTSTKIGSIHGYSFLWVVLAAAILMVAFTNISTHFGVLHKNSILQAITKQYGKWFAMVIGVSSFMAALCFQFGNNLGVGLGMESVTGVSAEYWPYIFTPFALMLIFFSKNLYKALEKLMTFLVVIMVLMFVINLVFIKPDSMAMIKGLLPGQFSIENIDDITAIVGTTFVLNGALYQAYLVQGKGWGLDDKQKGIRDSNIGVALLAIMSSLVIVTAAATIKPMGLTINSAADMAIQLDRLLGSYAKYVFAVGFIAAAFSSLIVNAVIGGGLLSDSFGLGKSMNERFPKVFTIVILLSGMLVASLSAKGIGKPIYSLVLAQAFSVLAVPAIAVGIFLIANNEKIMGEYKNGFFSNVIGLIGLIVVCFLTYVMCEKLMGLLELLG